MVKPRENRVPIMMSDEELKLIDDWRYKNRVATRSDAVRRLARIGTAVDEWVDTADQQMEAAIESFLKTTIGGSGEFPEDKLQYYNDIWNALTDVQLLVGQVSAVASEMRKRADVEDAIDVARTRRQAFIDEKDFQVRRRLGLLRKGEE
ncbi:hypothetical protein [Sinorhizobium fredii]|uniref:hypothetical protein n=1 Tax=Rhizobium fredii TaxID=380 RepID=UPI003CE4765D